MLAKARSPGPAGSSTQPDRPVAEEVPNTLTGQSGVTFKFRKYLRKLHKEGAWDEINERSLCHKCREAPQDPRITSCGHLYCYECLNTMLYEAEKMGQSHALCLECSEPFKGGEKIRSLEEVDVDFDIDSPSHGPSGPKRQGTADSEESEFAWISEAGAPLLSTKTEAVKSTINAWFEQDPGTKIIVFSLFLPMLKVLQRVAQLQRWDCCMYTGAMSAQSRDKAIEDFRDDPDKNILLASMKAGSLGLNLTMANKCILVDPFWNEAVEDQRYASSSFCFTCVVLTFFPASHASTALAKPPTSKSAASSLRTQSTPNCF